MPTTETTLDPKRQDQRSRASLGAGSLRLATLFGIEVRLHASVFVIFTLVVLSLARGLLPGWHPDWSSGLHWSAAILAGLLFFASLLAHEFSHALVARTRGVTTESITLFLFGGLASMESDPTEPRDEMLIAAAGPAMSFVLSFAFTTIALQLDPQLLEQEASAIDLSSLSFAGTLAVWLGSVNLMLAVFNLIPGFPMDGGRLFRAALWMRTGNKLEATKLAAKAGSLFGWILILCGIWLALTGSVGDGLWLGFIGWFVDYLATTSLRHQIIDSALDGVNVSALMRTRFDKVSAETSLIEFVDDFLLRSSQITWPVYRGDQDVGYITLEELPDLRDRTRLQGRTVGQFMIAMDDNKPLSPLSSARAAFNSLARQSHPQVIVENDQVVGLLQASDVLRWVATHMELQKPGPGAGAR